jgi:hypothetical protein
VRFRVRLDGMAPNGDHGLESTRKATGPSSTSGFTS